MRSPNHDSRHHDDDSISPCVLRQFSASSDVQASESMRCVNTVNRHGKDKRDFRGFEVQVEPLITHRPSKRHLRMFLEHQSAPIPCSRELPPPWSGFLHHKGTPMDFYPVPITAY